MLEAKSHSLEVYGESRFLVAFQYDAGLFCAKFSISFRNIKIYNRATLLSVAYFPFLGMEVFIYDI